LGGEVGFKATMKSSFAKFILWENDNLWGQFVGYVDPTCGTINKNTMVLVNLKALQVKSQPK
jgi:hypothetical protein